jgi:hypothetical protein
MATNSKDYRKLSRSDWTTPGEVSLAHIDAGSLQRIADSLESIAKAQNALLALEKNRASRLERRVRKLEGQS